MEGMDLIYAEIAASRVNCEVIFEEATSPSPIVTCRLRPWKGGRNSNSMVLAGGRTVDEALYYAYVGLYGGHYVPMDWSARADSVGLVYELSPKTTDQRRTSGLQLAPNASFDSFMGHQSAKGENGHQKATQSDSEPIRVAGRNKPRD